MKNRKDDHIRISLEEKVEIGTNGFEDVILTHTALPEIGLDYIDISTEFLGKKLKYPFVIEAMTGGTKEAFAINEALANVAEDLGVGIGVGSQRPAMEDKTLEETYSVVKKAAKNTLKIANLGAVQLNYGYGITECQMAVDMIGADALALHLNPLQEVIQPEGNVNFSDLATKISQICKKLSVPVIVKEVGCGISRPVAEKLISAGVGIIDVGGYGGTSWNLIEGYRAEGEKKEISEIFAGWGIPTAHSLIDIKDLGCKKIASGGMRTGIDAAKAIALGADLAGFALPLLKALDDQGEDGVYDYLHQMADELRVAMFLTGSSNISELKGADYKLVGRAAQILR
jgi:isopentenyl-diphosphate Delta-isomerase